MSRWHTLSDEGGLTGMCMGLEGLRVQTMTDGVADIRTSTIDAVKAIVAYALPNAKRQTEFAGVSHLTCASNV